MTSSTPTIFISHIHEEQELGKAVKTWTEDVFDGVTAFLSSDRDDLPAGRKWRDKIIARLQTAPVLVALISPVSLVRPWVNIELGAAWIRDTHIIPLCHSGQKFAALPPPFNDFEGIDLDDTDAAEGLLGGIADGLKRKLSPRLHFAQCLGELRAAAAKSTGVMPAPVASANASEELPEEQIALLVGAAATINRLGAEDITVANMCRLAGLQRAVGEYHLKQLVKRHFLFDLWRQGGPYYRIAPPGSGWLIEHGKMPA